MWDLQPRGVSHVLGPRQTMYAWARKRGAYHVPCGHRFGSHGPCLDIQGFPVLKSDYRYHEAPLSYPKSVNIMPHNITVNIVRHSQPFRPHSVRQSQNIERQRQNTARTSYSEGLPPLTSAHQRHQLGEEPPSANWYHNAVEQEYFRMRSVLSASSDHNGRTKNSNKGNHSQRIIKPATFLLEQPSNHEATTQAHSQVIDDRASPGVNSNTEISYNLLSDTASYNNEMTSERASDAIDSELADLMEKSASHMDKSSRPATPTEMVLRENDPSLHDIEAIKDDTDNDAILFPAEITDNRDLSNDKPDSEGSVSPKQVSDKEDTDNGTEHNPETELEHKKDYVEIPQVMSTSNQNIGEITFVEVIGDLNKEEQMEGREETKEVEEETGGKMEIYEKGDEESYNEHKEKNCDEERIEHTDEEKENDEGSTVGEEERDRWCRSYFTRN